MGEDAVTNIYNSKKTPANHLIDVEKNDLNQGHEEELDGAGGAEQNSKETRKVTKSAKIRPRLLQGQLRWQLRL